MLVKSLDWASSWRKTASSVHCVCGALRVGAGLAAATHKLKVTMSAAQMYRWGQNSFNIFSSESLPGAARATFGEQQTVRAS